MLHGNETEALLQNLICSQVEKNYPFAIYRLPNKDRISVVAQNSSNIYTLQNLEGMAGESGFLIAPFAPNDRTPIIWIKPDITDLSFFQKDHTKSLRVKFERGRKLREMTKKRFSRYLQYARRAIKSGKIDKVVIARAIHMPFPENFNLAAFFLKICDTYEWSFVNLFFIPGKGIWAGASPELLLGYSQGEFTTYSLAGTLPKYQLKKQKQKWTIKEKKEQEIVSSYIKQVVSAYPEVKLMLAGPETVEAGNIIHLRTIFS
ncbi:MAG: chorismate-binding protein, partial [Chitinophagales bacterium]|nr:chorismate-binding protein [Chitinophagales bacterium]